MAYMDEAFVLLREEAPELASHVVEALGGVTIRVEVDRSRFTVGAREGRLRTWIAPSASHLFVATSARTIVEVLDGSTELYDAIVDDRIHLRGEIGELERADQALVAFVNAAVRAPSVAALWERFQDEARGEA